MEKECKLRTWLRMVYSNWLVWFTLLFGLYVGLPFLAPLLMHWSYETPARMIYTVYSFLCHQLPERSLFLFGAKPSYWTGEIAAVWPTNGDLSLWRNFIGNSSMGWKVAWSDRMVSMFSSILVFGWLWWPIRRKIRPLKMTGVLLLMLPMAIDGITHMISDVSGLHSGFRFTNEWLAVLTQNSLPASFYIGDAIGSFNSWLRLITGLLFGLSMVWFGFPIIDEAISLSRRSNPAYQFNENR
jgi:uncharacterized membrane protein